ncbi:DUF6333 family protein [Streptomyces sp. NPDC001793]|uniref:DUF6333 family protein n=1 Tax=Streptomyces sp. NPDC001793 TaxID=3154657 RepID=UPI003320D1DC
MRDGISQTYAKYLIHVIWGDYLDLISCGLHIPLAGEALMASVFKVTRSEDTQDGMEEVWHQD